MIRHLDLIFKKDISCRVRPHISTREVTDGHLFKILQLQLKAQEQFWLVGLFPEQKSEPHDLKMTRILCNNH